MTNIEIIEHAVQRAFANGYVTTVHGEPTKHRLVSTDGYISHWQEPGTYQIVLLDVKRLIFNHDFAKALWGEDPAMFAMEDIKKDELGKVYMPGLTWWQYHLQQMVIAEDPIKYLGEHLPEPEA